MFKAFVLNSLAAALIATAIIEIRFYLKGIHHTREAIITFGAGFLMTFVVYNVMYVLLQYGSSLTASPKNPPYWYK